MSYPIGLDGICLCRCVRRFINNRQLDNKCGADYLILCLSRVSRQSIFCMHIYDPDDISRSRPMCSRSASYPYFIRSCLAYSIYIEVGLLSVTVVGCSRIQYPILGRPSKRYAYRFWALIRLEVQWSNSHTL